MSDLKPLVPRWVGEELMVGQMYVGQIWEDLNCEMWLGECCENEFCGGTEAEARAWVEAQLYGDNDE